MAGGWLPRGTVAGRSQVWSGTRTFAAGAGDTILDLTKLSLEVGFVLDLYATSTAPFLVVATRFYESGSKEIRYHVPSGSGIQIPVSGAVKVAVQNIGTASAQIGWAALTETPAPVRSPAIQDAISVVQDGGGGPGAWASLGWCRADRAVVDLFTTATIDAQLIDATGAQRAFFPVTGALAIAHPPLLELQVRHPGGAADTRWCVGSWRLGGA